MEVTTLGEKILVKPKVVDQTEGGIVLPDSAKENPFIGEIVDIGNDIPDYAKGLMVGDVVWWIPNAGSYFEIDRKGYLVIRPSDIICVKKRVVN